MASGLFWAFFSFYKKKIMKISLRKPNRGIMAAIFAIAVLLAVCSHSYAFRFVVMADSPDNETNKAGLNLACLEYLRGQILEMNPRP